MSAKREQLLAWIRTRPHPGGEDLGVRMRSTVFALLGVTTAACLVIVAILVHQGVPFLPSLPLPGMAAEEQSEAAVGPGERVGSIVATAGDRLERSTPTAGGRAGAGQNGPGRANEASKAVPPGPASAVAEPTAGGPVAAPVPVSETPGPSDAGAPGSPAAPAPTPVPASQPASTAGSQTDSELSKGSSGKGKSSKGGSGKSAGATALGQAGTDAATPSAKTPSKVPAYSPEVPPMTDAEPEPVTDADSDGKGHGHRR